MTVVYPSWAVSVERNRSATNIVSVTPNGTTQGAATEIPSGYEYTVAMCPADSSGTPAVAVKLPDDAVIGDAFEIHNNGDGAGLSVFPPAGETIGTSAVNVSRSVTATKGQIFRKTAADAWHAVGST